MTIHTDISPLKGYFLLEISYAPLLRPLLPSEKLLIKKCFLLLFILFAGTLPNIPIPLNPQIPNRVQLGYNRSTQPTGMDGRDIPGRQINNLDPLNRIIIMVDPLNEPVL